MNENLGEDYDEDEHLDYLESQERERILQLQSQLSHKSDDELKILVKKKVIRYNKESGDPFESWMSIGKVSIVPSQIINEKNLCWGILHRFGEGFYFLQTWRSYTPLFKKKKTRKLPKGLCNFWLGVITREGFRRDSGELRGVINSQMPIHQFHQWIQ